MGSRDKVTYQQHVDGAIASASCPDRGKWMVELVRVPHSFAVCENVFCISVSHLHAIEVGVEDGSVLHGCAEPKSQLQVIHCGVYHQCVADLNLAVR